MAPLSDKQWDAARVQLREWLAEHSLSQSELARLAGVHRSVVHRFLERERPLSEQTAARLYNVIKLNLGETDRARWIEWLNLREAKRSLSDALDGEAPNPQMGYKASIELGYYWLRKAWSLIPQDMANALVLFARAEQAFGRWSGMAAFSACEMIQHLINIGDLKRAELEVFRVEHAYRHVMDLQTHSRFLHLKSMVAYDGRDFPLAMRIVHQSLALGVAYGFPTFAEHLLALVQLGMAERMRDADKQKQLLLGQAEENMRLMVRRFEQEDRDSAVSIGFQYFRLAQIVREQGRRDDAQRYRKLARDYFRGEGALFHVPYEEANLALLDGETRRARLNASRALDAWTPIGYAGGLARTAAIVSLSLRMEGRQEDALEPAIMAASLAPYESCYKGGLFTQLVYEISHDILQHNNSGQHARLIDSLQQRLQRRSGYFALLDHTLPDRSEVVNELISKL